MRRRGRPTLRTPEGERGSSWATSCIFPKASPDASTRNDSDEPFRVLLGSTKSRLDLAGYPDSGKLLIDMPGGERMLRDGPCNQAEPTGTASSEQKRSRR